MSIKRINLALQGGGAHGAFTWGVLDRLLDEDRLEVSAISGTSAGALNGAALKAGHVAGGREGARENLNWLWAQMGAVHDLRMPAWMAASIPGAISAAMEYAMPLPISDTVSPYDYGPFYSNPLRRVVERFAYDKVCAEDAPRLFVGATNVRTGKIRIFQGDEIAADPLLASACLPTLFQAIEIDGEAYWDGGYTGNPALFPLFERDLPDDIVIVNINPLERPDLPRSAQEISNRVNEISFNSSLLREMRAINFVQRLLDNGTVPEGAMKRLHVHMIADDKLMSELSVATKMLPNPFLLNQLKEAGRVAADKFLEAHWDDLGVRSSTDLTEMFN
ncbi:patatin-like phospholipase family protein [Roseovarius dicentrarchi]|uniref:patatin-like phospholipase family protein n=1 Tax=Roseovarius dicentrarchi TaxID=2250573 RepID=UPI000DEB9A82|nr:patatin-like phospholipase family protein [Roseovarius dicentrarchi]